MKNIFSFFMNQVKNENRAYYSFILFVLTIVSIFATKFYISQKKENQALKLKLILVGKDKRAPKPWGRLLAPVSAPLPFTISQSKILTIKPINNSEKNLFNKTTEELAANLEMRMSKIRNYDFNNIQTTIEIADELISREPDSYSAYKAKLIALLIEEAKLNITIDDSEVNQLLEIMARFELSKDSVIKKEVTLISNANKEINQLSDKLNHILNEEVDTQALIELTGSNNPAYAGLNTKSYDLIFQEDETRSQIENLESSINTDNFPAEEFINEDIVQIPFMRMLAKNDYDGILENAEAFALQFPSSTIGYFYLVMALEHFGRKNEVIELIAQSPLSSTDQNLLMEKLRISKNEDPKKYWEKLHF